MKNILRLGVFSALLFATSLPVYSAPSDSDMGFAGGREPTAADVGYQNLMVRGNRDDSSSGGATAGAAQGQVGRTSQQNSDTTWFDSNRETSQYLPSTVLPYRADPSQQSQSRQHTFQQMTQGAKMVNQYAGTENGSVGMNPLALNSTSRINFKGPQTLGFKDGPLGFGTVWQYKNGFGGLQRTGTGSVNASICAPDGKQ